MTDSRSWTQPEDAFLLCYVSYPWAWFTTCPLDKQWGDDWNDAPYEHNAGTPYSWGPHMQQKGREIAPYLITRLAYDGPFETPDAYVLNSSYSVQHINEGLVPWLVTDRYVKDHRVVIPAGMPMPQFERAILEGGGNVWRPIGSPLASAVKGNRAQGGSGGEPAS